MWRKFDLRQFICSLVLCCMCMFATRAYAAEDGNVLSDATAKVHTEMSEDSDIIANLIIGSMFDVIDAQLDLDGNTWYQVRTDFGAEGYVKSDELDRVISAMSQNSDSVDTNNTDVNNADGNATDENNADGNATDENNAGGNATDVNNADANDAGGNATDENNAGGNATDINNADGNDTDTDNTAGNDVGNNPLTNQLGELKVLETINFRREPSTDSEILAKIEQDTELPYFEEYVNEQGERWYRVLYENMTGYVTDSAVAVTQSDESEQPDDADKIDGEAAQPTANENSAQDSQTQSNTQSATKSDSGIAAVSNSVADISAVSIAKGKRHIKLDLLVIGCVLGDICGIVVLVLLLRKTYKLVKIRKPDNRKPDKKLKRQEKRNNAYRR